MLSFPDGKRDHFVRELPPFSNKCTWGSTVAYKENATAGKLGHPSGAAVTKTYTLLK